MTDQTKKYEEAAKAHASTIIGIPAKEILPDDTIINGFLAGAIFAHNDLGERAEAAEHENEKLREALRNLYKEIRSRFATDDAIAFDSMSNDLAKPMTEARKLLEAGE
jgi:hypothetical protein